MILTEVKKKEVEDSLNDGKIDIILAKTSIVGAISDIR